jgi:hypothetical protein
MHRLRRLFSTGYRYRELRHKDSIRIIKLLPGSADAPLQCEILEHRKSDGLDFEALSYVWGDQDFCLSIHEVKSGASIGITANLANALRQFRSERTERLLWIDQICINQSDNKEKAQQVAQMDEIYCMAKRTLVWLGNTDVAEALETLRAIGIDFESFGYSMVFPFPYSPRGLEGFEKSTQLIDSCDTDALKQLYSSPWFERVWVVQEFVLAQDLSIHGGSAMINYELFSKAACVLFVISRHPKLRNIVETTKPGLVELFESDKYKQSWELIRQRERYRALQRNTARNPDLQPTTSTNPSPETADSFKDWPFIYYCIQLRRLKCFNQLDRVYAVLGFANNLLKVYPDYSTAMTPAKLWTEVAVRSLENSDLTTLHWAGVRTDGLEQTTMSFVTDMDKPILEIDRLGGHGGRLFHAGTVELPRVRSVQIQATRFLRKTRKGPILPIVTGRIIDTVSTKQLGIKSTNEAERPRWTIDALREIFKQMQQWQEEFAEAYPDERFSIVFARSVIADNAREQFDTAFGEGSGRNDDKIPVYFQLALNSVVDESGRLLILERGFLNGMHLGQFKMSFSTESGECVTYALPSEEEPVHIVAEHDPVTGFSISRVFAFEGPIVGHLNYFMGLVSVNMYNRFMFLTQQGYLGVGPTNMHDKDIVFIPRGAETPFILRPVRMPDADGKGKLWQTLYQVVGECYLHGMMDGEAFREGSAFPEEEIVLM